MDWITRLELARWWIPAACDLVALSAATSAAVLLRSRRHRVAEHLAVSEQPGAAPAPVAIKLTDLAEELPGRPGDTPARTDVKRALAAIGRWENNYGGARGIAELARFVDAQRPAQKKVSA